MRSTLGSLYRQALLLPALVASALLTLAPSPVRAHVSTEWGTDRPGGDIPGKKFDLSEGRARGSPSSRA